MPTIGIPLPSASPFDVVGVGVNAVDHLCTVPAYPAFNSKTALVDYDCQPGGQVATALVALQRWGCRTAYVGTFGGDQAGDFSRASLVQEGIDVRYAYVRQNVPNQLAIILIDQATGERTIMMNRDTALTLDPDEIERAVVTSGRVLHLDGYDVAAATRAATWARAAGIPVVVDVDMEVGAVDALLAVTDAVIVSLEFALARTGAAAPELALRRLAAETGAALVVITRGAEGCMALMEGALHVLPAYAIQCVDSTGAGDVFHAGFIYGLLRDWPLERVLRFANASAALKCTARGGRPGIPTVTAAIDLMAG